MPKALERNKNKVVYKYINILMTYVLIFQCYLCYPSANLKVLSEIFSGLLHAQKYLCDGDGGMTGLYHILVSIIIILKDPITIIYQKLTLHVTKVCTSQFGYR